MVGLLKLISTLYYIKMPAFNLYSPTGDDGDGAPVYHFDGAEPEDVLPSIQDLFDDVDSEDREDKAEQVKKQKKVIKQVPLGLTRLKQKIKKNTTIVNLKKALRLATGSFTFSNIPKSNKKMYKLNIVNGWDALIIGAMLTDYTLLEGQKMPALPAGFMTVFRQIKFTGNVPDTFLFLFKDDLKKYFGTVKDNKVINPTTNRKINYTPNKPSSTYKKKYKAIKLKAVVDNNLTHYNTINYEINKWCVPSYLEKYLSVKHYKIIRKKLIRIKTPTYPQLTKLLNEVNYGLEVRTIENEILQEQKEFVKKIKILIHNSHMYVLTNTKQLKKHKKIELNDVDFKEMKNKNNHLLNYNDYEFYDNKNKYVIKTETRDSLKKEYNLTNTYTMNNINFYESVNIRPPKYCNGFIDNVSSLDIKHCYKNILINEKYYFAVQNGLEKTNKFSGKILNYGFYYCEFKEMNKVEKILFSKNTWLYGDIIILLKMKSKLNISLEHIPCSYVMGKKTKNEYKNLDISMFTGTLGQIYKPSVYTKYDITDTEEKEALLLKYGKDSFLENKSGTFCINKLTYKRNSGLYAYMSIWSYNILQIYILLCQIFNKYKNKVEIRKIYTDSVTFNKKINDDEIKKIDDILTKNFNFSIHRESSDYFFTTNNDYTYKYGADVEEDMKIYEKKDIETLLNNDKSFALYGKGGYGKTYTIKNIIIPNLEKNNKKYILASTTKKNADSIGGVTINSILCNKDKSINNIIKTLNDYDYIIIDEVSQITSYILLLLQRMRQETNISYIFVGDENQCGSVDNSDSWINTEIVNNLVEYNKVVLKWSKYSRYTKQYDDILNKLIKKNKTAKNKQVFNQYVVSLFKKQGLKETSDKNKKYLVYTHEKGKKVMKLRNIKYSTVHSAQGETININYSIYEWDKMPFKVLYTALSRGEKLNSVFLIY